MGRADLKPAAMRMVVRRPLARSELPHDTAVLARYLIGKIPIFGICYGVQLVALQLGGELLQQSLDEEEATDKKLTEMKVRKKGAKDAKGADCLCT